MSDAYIGEIRMFAGNYAPQDWALCNGQLLSIQQNQALFSILGTTYGGDGKTNFALPDLRGRVPINMGQGAGLSNYAVGQKGGTENTTLTSAQMPSHTHAVTSATAKLSASSTAGASNTPTNNFIAAPVSGTARINAFNTTSDTQMAGNSVSVSVSIASTGSGQPYLNMQPYLCINFIIALVGEYPARS